MNVIDSSTGKYIINGIKGNMTQNYLQITPPYLIILNNKLDAINKLKFSTENDLRTWVTTYGSKFIDIFEANETQLNSINSSISAINNTLSDHNTRITANTTKNNEQDGRLTAIESKNSSQDQTLASLQNQISSNDTDIENLQNKDNSLQSQITSNDNDIKNLQSKDTDLQSQITSNDNDISALKTRCTNIESKNTQQDSTLSSLQSQISSNDTDIKNLQTKDTNLQSQITSNDNDISGLKTRCTNIESKNTQQDTSISNLGSRLATNEATDKSQDEWIAKHKQEYNNLLTKFDYSYWDLQFLNPFYEDGITPTLSRSFSISKEDLNCRKIAKIPDVGFVVLLVGSGGMNWSDYDVEDFEAAYPTYGSLYLAKFNKDDKVFNFTQINNLINECLTKSSYQEQYYWNSNYSSYDFILAIGTKDSDGHSKLGWNPRTGGLMKYAIDPKTRSLYLGETVYLASPGGSTESGSSKTDLRYYLRYAFGINERMNSDNSPSNFGDYYNAISNSI